jgi:acyl carrier protein
MVVACNQRENEMNDEREKLMKVAFDVLCSIAPEINRDEVLPAKPLRQQIDLDSMDWLNFLLGLHQKLGVEIAEKDYASLVCFNDVIDYVQEKRSLIPTPAILTSSGEHHESTHPSVDGANSGA